MAAKGARDWAQLDAYEAEYAERLAGESRYETKTKEPSQFLAFLRKAAHGAKGDDFYADELKSRDEATRRLFLLRGKIQTLRQKVGLPDETIWETEKPFLPDAQETPKKRALRLLADPAPVGFFYPVTFEEIRALLAELPPEHTELVHEIRLSNQKHTGADADWLDGEIRLHCLIARGEPDKRGNPTGKRLMGRTETGADVERWGGDFEWEGTKCYAIWPLDAYKTFVLKRVLVHEIAHGVAELPGFADKVSRAGSVEKFCEQYAETFYKPAGKSVRLGF